MFEILLKNMNLAWGVILQGTLRSTEEYLGRADGIPQIPYDQHDQTLMSLGSAIRHAFLLRTSMPCFCLANWPYGFLVAWPWRRD